MSLQLRQCQQRPFFTTSYRFYSAAAPNLDRPKRKHSQGHSAPKMPAYPYGRATTFKQRDSGLYGGAVVQYGHSRTEKKIKKFDDVSRKIWHPNVHRKRLWSDALNQFVRIKVQIRVLRTIDKVGGLDKYLLGEKPARIKALGVRGWSLRWQIMQTKGMKVRREDEREALGLPREGLAAYGRAQMVKMQRRADSLAERYVRIVDKEEAERKALEEEEEARAAEQQLLDEAGEQQQESAEPRPDSSEEILMAQEDDQSQLDKRIAQRLGELDTVAIHIAVDTRRASRTLPLPDLQSSQNPKENLWPSVRLAETGRPLLPPQEYLLNSLTRLAKKLERETVTFIDAARTRLAERAAEKEALQEKKALARDHRAARDGAGTNAEGIPPHQYHEEIDTAIASGPSTILPLYHHYLSQQRTLLASAQADRKKRLLDLANKYLRQLRTHKSKGGKGVFVKSSAWDQCRKKAARTMETRPTTRSLPPEGLTTFQWLRLYRAGRQAIRDHEEEVRRERGREARERKRGERQVRAMGEAKGQTKGVKRWMNEREIGVFERAKTYLSGFFGRTQATA